MKSNKIFIVWGIIIAVLLIALTIICFILKKENEEYEELENTLRESAIKYVDINFLYPEEEESIIIESDALIENGYLEELSLNGDICTGYVKIIKNSVYEYNAYIKCSNYKSTGYEER